LPGLLSPKFDLDSVKEVMQEYFGGISLGELKKKIIITSIDLNEVVDEKNIWEPVTYHNFTKTKDSDESLADIILKSGAAPRFFKSYQGHIDGGIAYNNPSTLAV